MSRLDNVGLWFCSFEFQNSLMAVSQIDDKVWFDEATKLAQICNEVSSAYSDGRSVLLLSHFDATLSRLSSMLRAKEIAHDRFSTFNPSELCAGIQGKVWIGSARAFQVTTEITSPAAGTPLNILVAEHHPLQSRDQALIDAAAKLACDGQLCFHFSIDDPVMKHFGSDTIKALYERLGIPKDECISHSLVTTAIRAAQEKIESRVGKDVTTTSAEDWFNYNMRIKQ
jgi:preprotein translocase subunit SecA